MEQQNLEALFLEKRTPVFLDPEKYIIRPISGKFSNSSWDEIFYQMGYGWLGITRGYILDDHMVLYYNDFEIPNVNTCILTYIFTYFKDIKWIGLGCNKGKPGEIWEPRIKVFRNEGIC